MNRTASIKCCLLIFSSNCIVVKIEWDYEKYREKFLEPATSNAFLADNLSVGNGSSHQWGLLWTSFNFTQLLLLLGSSCLLCNIWSLYHQRDNLLTNYHSWDRGLFSLWWGALTRFPCQKLNLCPVAPAMGHSYSFELQKVQKFVCYLRYLLFVTVQRRLVSCP